MFFRWLKCVMPCRHWFAESRQRVLIQIYLCLIKALLLAELTGRKPNKRMMELLQWHQLGEVSDEELVRLLAEEEAHRAKRAAKNSLEVGNREFAASQVPGLVGYGLQDSLTMLDQPFPRIET